MRCADRYPPSTPSRNNSFVCPQQCSHTNVAARRAGEVAAYRYFYYRLVANHESSPNVSFRDGDSKTS